MMQRNHRDRPGVRLTTEERRRFAEIAVQLRYELDGLAFPDAVGNSRLPGRRRRPAFFVARAAGRATRVVAGLSRRLATPFVLALLGLGAVIGAAMTTGDLRFALTVAGSFTLAWATTTAALQLARRLQAKRVQARLRLHQTSP